MQLNATLFGQMITFAIFVWFTMRIIWPILTTQLNERKQRIIDGLAAAEKGQKLLVDAEARSKAAVTETKAQCQQLLVSARQESAQLITDAKVQAHKEYDAIVASGHEQIAQELRQAKTALQAQLASLVVMGAEKILERSINPEDNQDILNSLAKKLA